MMAINKIVLLIIFLIILLLSFFILFGMGSPIGEQLNWQNQLRQCCQAFRATGCEDVGIICNEETMENIDSLRMKLNMNDKQLKSFCECKPQCDDNIDNDLDGEIDFPDDPECASSYDEDESM